jgi:hypothetical protein
LPPLEFRHGDIVVDMGGFIEHEKDERHDKADNGPF